MVKVLVTFDWNFHVLTCTSLHLSKFAFSQDTLGLKSNLWYIPHLDISPFRGSIHDETYVALILSTPFLI